MFKIVLQKNSKSRILSILLSFWVYTYGIFYFVPLLLPSSALLMYIWLLGIDILILCKYRYLSIRLTTFLIAYVLIAITNVAVVPYKYYVIIDSFSGLAIFLPALLIISCRMFNLRDFLKIWNKFAIITTILSPMAIILVQKKLINYGVFTYLNLPNCVAFSYILMIAKKTDKRKYSAFTFAGINVLIILIFGGRMAAFAASFSIFLAYMLSPSVKKINKCLIILVTGFLGATIIRHIDTIIYFAQPVFNKYNLNSRTFSLFTKGDGLYLTNRDIIYDEVINYIRERNGFPGGFGVSLYISKGHFYHPHNLFLQLSVMFGVIGCILLFLLIFYRISRIKTIFLIFEYKFTLLLLAEYLVISFTGGSILTNFAAIIGIGMLFFYKNAKEKNLKIDKYEN